jgi:L-threonylcarbamoyladenylate synthase
MKVVHTESLSEEEFELILSVLRAGGVIGFPTDTAYGLGADPFNVQAVAKIFKLKGRPETKPILLLVDSLEMAKRISRPLPILDSVAKAFWPGPLTLVLPAKSSVPQSVTAGTGTVGVRLPIAPFATELTRRLGNPITATSANLSGQTSCITAEEVRAQLQDQLPILVDGGTLPARSGSTLLDLTVTPPVLLREGPVSFESLNTFFEGRLRRAAS